MRINKYLATCGVASRRKCEEYIIDGRVKVNNKVIKDLFIDINTKKDKVMVDDKMVCMPKGFVYIKINKPKGYICSSNDEKGRKIVLDLIKDNNVRLFSVGRLDYDSEGLLFLTTDGDFANFLTNANNHIDKTYIVNVEGELKESELAVMRAGVVEQDGTRLPKCKIEFKSFQNNVTRLEITIDEGKNRQIRRMFEAIGKNIIMLKRVSIGGVKLGGLKRGEYRDLTEQELLTLTHGDSL